MSAMASKAITGKLITGTFDLYQTLVEHSTEERSVEIMAQVNQMVDGYRSRNPDDKFGAPGFAFGRVEGDSDKIELYVMRVGEPNTQMGIVELKWKKMGSNEILVLPRQTAKQKEETKRAHKQATLSEVRGQLLNHGYSVHRKHNQLLALFLDHLEAEQHEKKMDLVFDLDFGEEEATIAAFGNGKRIGAVTVFHQPDMMQ